MRNNQNPPNRRIDSNNNNGRQLPSTSPLYNNSRSRTPYRSQSRNNSNNKTYSRDNRYYQGHRNPNNNYNNRSGSYNRNNYNRSRTNSYNRNNNNNRYSNSRSNSRYTNRSQLRQNSPYSGNNNNSYSNNNRRRHYSKDSNKSDRYRQRSCSNNRHYSNNNNNNSDDRRHSTQREQNDRYHSKDRRTDGNKYNNNNKNRINNIGTDRQNDEPPGIDDYEYTSESSNDDQEILDKFYHANEDTCNTVLNTLESNPTWILPMYQCNKIEQDFTKQRPIEIDLLLDSGATLNLLNEDTWKEKKYNNPDIRLEQANKTLTAANNTTIETFGTVKLNLTPDKTSNSRNKPQHNFSIHFYATQCNHNILGTPFFKEYIETIKVNTNKLTINTNTIMDNDITFFMNSTKEYPYYSRLYPIFNKEPLYLERDQHKCTTFPIPIFKQMEKSNGKTIYRSMYYFEPINKYQNLSFTDKKDLSIKKNTL